MSSIFLGIKDDLDKIYKILPYVGLIKNKNQFFLSVVLRRSLIKLKLKHGINLTVKKTQVETLIDLLGVLKYSSEYYPLPNGTITIQFDKINKFAFSLDLASLEIRNILELFHYGIKFGAYFQSKSSLESVNYKKSIKILEMNDKKIIQTHNGLKFYLDQIQAWPIIETFILQNHDIEFFGSLTEKIVFDVGAHTGDTALFYASQGAKIYAFEPLKSNYKAMLRNLELNPTLCNNIVPINAAIGKDEILEIHHSKINKIDGMASISTRLNDGNHTTSKVRGYGLKSAMKENNVIKIDLLKMDCKGCEFFLNEEDLANVNCLKIEYSPFDNYNLENLTSLLNRNGFKFITYLHNPRRTTSPKHHGTLLAVKC